MEQEIKELIIFLKENNIEVCLGTSRSQSGVMSVSGTPRVWIYADEKDDKILNDLRGYKKSFIEKQERNHFINRPLIKIIEELIK